MKSDRTLLWVLILAFAGSMWVFLLGAKSDIRLGDEPTHYTLASIIYKTKERPLFFPNIHSSPLAQKSAGTEVLWHYLLSGTWRLYGAESKVLAQLYQAGWYFLLVVATYLLGSAIYTERRGLYSALLVATIPMMATYSIMLYLDIPLMALIVLCFFVLLKRQYFWAGVLLGLAILTKRNAYLFLPFLVFTIFYTLRDISSIGELRTLCTSSILKEGCKKLVVFIIPAVLINLPDIYFRYHNFHTVYFPNTDVMGHSFCTTPPGFPSLDVPFVHPENFVVYPENLIKYPGIAIYICLGLYLLRRLYSVKDLPITMTVIGYILLFPLTVIILYLKENPNVSLINNLPNIANTNLSFRYLGPVLPLLAIVTSGGLASLESRRWRNVLVGLCIMQTLLATLHVYNARSFSPALKEAYEYIRIYTPDNSSILTTNTDIVINAERKVMWSSEGNMPDLPFLLWKANANQAESIFKKYGITHLFIDKHSIWDDTYTRNIGQYPRSFVAKLPDFDFLVCLFDNKAASLWAVKPAFVISN